METTDKSMSSPDNSGNEAARAAKDTIDRLSKAAHKAVDKAGEAALPAAEWVTERGGSLKVTGRKLMDDSCTYIGEHPMKSVGVAFGLGFILAKLMR